MVAELEAMHTGTLEIRLVGKGIIQSMGIEAMAGTCSMDHHASAGRCFSHVKALQMPQERCCRHPSQPTVVSWMDEMASVCPQHDM